MTDFAEEAPDDEVKKDLTTIKRALGALIIGLSTGKMVLPDDLMAELGLKQQRVVVPGVLGS